MTAPAVPPSSSHLERAIDHLQVAILLVADTTRTTDTMVTNLATLNANLRAAVAALVAAAKEQKGRQ